MVAGARLALDLGWEVRGSDMPLYPPTSELVSRLGVKVYSGYSEHNLDWEPDLVIIGNALSRGNVEVEETLSRRLPYQSLPEWLKENILRYRKPVAICGTHGKTTTTSLTAFLLDAAGFDNGFLVGGQMLDFDFPARLGAQDQPFVIEGDEYDTAFFDKRAKFFHYLPEVAVVTSLEFDHGDIYNNLEEIRRAFRLMLRQIPRDGCLIASADSAETRELARYAFSRVRTYGFAADADWRGELLGKDRKGMQRMRIFFRQKIWGDISSPLPGRHNLANTLAAIAVCAEFSVNMNSIREALPNFHGIRRRMEVFLRHEGVTFIDDFAHHPTAIRETIRAAKSVYDGRILVLLEPRSNTMVTNRFQSDIAASLRDADAVWIGAIHRQERIPPELRLDRDALVEHLCSQGISARAFDTPGEIVHSVTGDLREGDCVLILSNGSFGGIHSMFRQQLGYKDE